MNTFNETRQYNIQIVNKYISFSSIGQDKKLLILIATAV